MPQKPIIIGSSLTGLLISHSLSRQGIDHVLIGGDRPNVAPRLGESMNEGASLACWNLLDKKYQRYFYRKSHISLLGSKLSSMIMVGSPNRCLKRLSARLSDRSKPASLRSLLNGLCHLDRSAFDPVFYEDATQNAHCEFINNPSAEITFDSADDLVTEVEVGGRQFADPPYVFDATGFKGIVADAAGVSTKPLSGLQHVAWTHLIATTTPDDRKHWWLNGTNLVRLDQATDGIEGIGWIIPIGRRISIGISVDANSDSQPSDTVTESKFLLIDAYLKAIEKRGLPIRELYPEIDQVFDIKHRYYHRERAYGSNWLLAGSTFTQLWFPTSSGVGTSTLAATLAGKLIEEPEKFGRFYQKKLEYALEFHNLIDSIVQGPQLCRDQHAFEFWAAWVSGSLRRSHSDLQVINREYESKSFWRYSWIKNLAMAFRRNLWLQIATVGSFSTFVERPKLNAKYKQGTPDHLKNDQSPDRFRSYFNPRALMVTNAVATIPRYLASRLSSLIQDATSYRSLEKELQKARRAQQIRAKLDPDYEMDEADKAAHGLLSRPKWFDYSRKALLPPEESQAVTESKERIAIARREKRLKKVRERRRGKARTGDRAA